MYDYQVLGPDGVSSAGTLYQALYKLRFFNGDTGQ